LLEVVVVEGAQPRPSRNRKFHPGYRVVMSLWDWKMFEWMV
jgi:hypothetical protein